MDTPNNVNRFSSCRGVAFEIKPRADPFALPINLSKKNEHQKSGSISKRSWRSSSSFKVFPYASSMVERSMSHASSHFCDLESDDDNGETGEYPTLHEDEEVIYDLEKQTSEKSSLPLAPSKREQPKANNKPKQSRLSVILLDQGLFTVYKRLFVVCLILNITGLVLAATENFEYAKNRAALFSIGNILALTMCRSEAILRIVFWLAVKVLGRSRVPLRVKTCTTSFLQCLGCVHSGCGVSSIAWLVYAIVLTLNDRASTSSAIICVAYTILGLLLLSSLAAFPLVRHMHHNIFERTHRFAGWSALLFLWTFVILTILYDPMSKSYSTDLGSRLVKQQEFWFTLAISILIILPWLTVRRVPVKVTAPSGHASIIKFEGGVKPGILGRISPSPFSEWHAFGIISDGKDEHMMLAGAVGDFTKSLVANPPTHLWVRSVHFAGLPYLVNMYDKVVLVATGSGICVFLSFLLQPSKADVCVVWVAKGIEQNFGKEIKMMMSGHHKDKVIVHDTAVSGRPDVSKMSVDAATKWGADCVIVTSNPEGSRVVVNSCKAAGFAAFGPIWDS